MAIVKNVKRKREKMSESESNQQYIQNTDGHSRPDEKATIANEINETDELLKVIAANELKNRQLIQENAKMLQRLKDQYDYEVKKTQLEKTVQQDIEETRAFLHQHLNINIGADDPAVYMLVYTQHIVRREMLNESERLNTFMKQFDERLVTAQRFIESLEGYQAAFLERITSEHYEQRIQTANNLSKALNDAINQGVEKIKEATNTEPKSSKIMMYLLYGLLGLGIINLVV